MDGSFLSKSTERRQEEVATGGPRYKESQSPRISEIGTFAQEVQVRPLMSPDGGSRTKPMASLHTSRTANNAVLENTRVTEDKYGLICSTLKWPGVAVDLLVTRIKRSDKYGAVYQAKHCSDGSLLELELRVYSFSRHDPSVKKKYLKRNCREWKDRRRFLDSWKEKDLVVMILSNPGDWVSSLPLRYHWTIIFKRSQRAGSYSGGLLKKQEKNEDEEGEKETYADSLPTFSKIEGSPLHVTRNQAEFPIDRSAHLRFMYDGKTAAQKERARKVQRKRRQNRRVKAKAISGKDAPTESSANAENSPHLASNNSYATELLNPIWSGTYYGDYYSTQTSIQKEHPYYSSPYYKSYIEYYQYQPSMYGQISKPPAKSPQTWGWGGNNLITTSPSSLKYKPRTRYEVKSEEQNATPKQSDTPPSSMSSEASRQNDPPTPKKNVAFQAPVADPQKKCGTAALTRNTRQTLLKMLLEYLFSDDNLRKDIALRQAMNAFGFVAPDLLATLTKVRRITTEVDDIRCCCMESDFFETLKFSGKIHVRRRLGWENWTLVETVAAGNGIDVKLGKGNGPSTTPETPGSSGHPGAINPERRKQEALVQRVAEVGRLPIRATSLSTDSTEKKNYNDDPNKEYNGPEGKHGLEVSPSRWHVRSPQMPHETNVESSKPVIPDLETTENEASPCNNEKMEHNEFANKEEGCHQAGCTIGQEEIVIVPPRVSHSSKEKAKKGMKRSMKERKARKR